MKPVLKLGLASAMALSTAMPAFAQYAPSPDQPPTPQQYQQDMRDYQRDQSDYQDQRADYEAARRAYERRRDDYDAARAAYDARYGSGSYARTNGPEPAWDDSRWARHDADATAYDDPCRQRKNANGVAGGIIGALAGAALGSNVAARNARPEGAVLGAVIGGAAGVGIGRSSAKCDQGGYWFSYDETVPYREGAYDRQYGHSGRYDYSYYSSHRCRLAPAPIDWGDHTEYRYVRVCPDGDGRYRITG